VSIPSVALVRALAQALSPGRATLLAGEPIDSALALAGCPVKSLVVVTPDADPDAPAGETATGAPLRMRPDFGERPSSQDLVVDSLGTIPPEALVRLLKKGGLYLTSVDGPALAALPHRHALAVRVVEGWLVEGERPTLAFEPTDVPAAAQLFVGGKAPIATLPGVCRVEAVQPAPPAPPERPDLEAARDAAEAHAAEVSARLDAVVAEFEACRNELALRRTADRRADLVRARADAEKDALLAELETLHRRLAEIEGAGADREAAEDRRGAAEALTRSVLGGLGELLRARGLADLGPAPPVSADEAVNLWLVHTLTALSARLEAGANAEAERRALSDALAALRPMVSASPEPAPLAHAPVGIASADVVELQSRVEALTAALDAQENLRLAERAELSRARRAVDALQRRVDAGQAAAQAASAESTRLRMARATTDEENHRLRRELAWRDAREAELEQIIRGHLEMQALLSSALEAAEATRDAAVAECRLADRNLELLRSQLGPTGTPGTGAP
jgi:hypothetical protein